LLANVIDISLGPNCEEISSFSTAMKWALGMKWVPNFPSLLITFELNCKNIYKKVIGSLNNLFVNMVRRVLYRNLFSNRAKITFQIRELISIHTTHIHTLMILKDILVLATFAYVLAIGFRFKTAFVSSAAICTKGYLGNSNTLQIPTFSQMSIEEKAFTLDKIEGDYIS
jgi:uncharacterized membrane protein YcgQ (UPF0703/DUF1980 family)